ncbi:diguanylate cyclase [Massilia sp. CF038]|uniref:diguanylate cyclase n=1 Tax=Massilia sp. CF038 TaxID=1881045 RepID=UPI00092369C4|nr:diguanylate cyclase [Massilia sp. CF038]SHH12908.1 response regulator receiver modulated diguanylate cyclase [Massilia sp. CF038]
MSSPEQSSTATESISAPGITEDTVRVLLVDDQRIIAEAVRRMLGPDIEFHFVTDPAEAEAAAVRLQPHVILQDLVMPGIDGFALIEAYRANAALRAVPVIVLSAKEDPKLKAQGFALGANDYMIKLPDQLEMQARVRYHAAGYISALQRDAAFRALRASEQKLAAANIELERLAALDALTGIANRRRFDAALAAEWQRGQRERSTLSLLICDVDCFKAYNDELGHPAGDLCLKKVAAVLTENLKRPADLAARYGGEEFALLLPDTPAAGALAVAESCRSHLEALALAHGGAAAGVVTMSIGVATLIPGPDGSPAQLVAGADSAMYEAKNGGRNRVCTHSPIAQGPA